MDKRSTGAPLGILNQAAEVLDGLDALRAASTEAQTRNQLWARERFTGDRELAADYLKAIIAYPWLFRWQDLPSIVGHVEGVVDHFSADGLTREHYLSAVAADPTLVRQKSAVVIDNIEQVLAHFRGAGLSRSDYLRAALDQPILFRMRPQAVIDNITDLEEWLAGAVTCTADCLRKAVDRPRLFSRGPDALPSLSLAPISDAGESSAPASAAGIATAIPKPDGPAAPAEGVPTSQISAPIIHELTRALGTRSEAA